MRSRLRSLRRSGARATPVGRRHRRTRDVDGRAFGRRQLAAAGSASGTSPPLSSGFPPKERTIDQIDQRTAELEQTFNKIRTPPLEQLKRLADRGDALAAQAEIG